MSKTNDSHSRKCFLWGRKCIFMTNLKKLQSKSFKWWFLLIRSRITTWDNKKRSQTKTTGSVHRSQKCPQLQFLQWRPAHFTYGYVMYAETRPSIHAPEHYRENQKPRSRLKGCVQIRGTRMVLTLVLEAAREEIGFDDWFALQETLRECKKKTNLQPSEHIAPPVFCI